MAWGVLLIAFAVFCILCGVLSVGVHFFLFESTVGLQAILTVGRGTATITEPDLNERPVRVNREIINGTNVSTDLVAQATILIIDPQQNHRQIAAITLNSNSSLSLFDVERPRFEWSNGQYTIELVNFNGSLDVYVANDLGRSFGMTIRTETDAQIYLAGSGHYMIEATATYVQLINRDGLAALISPLRPQEGISVAAGQQGVLYIGSPDVVISPAYVELMVNAFFQESRENEAVPLAWECSSNADSPPTGLLRTEHVDTRPVLRMVRAENANSHGETRCRQGFEPASTGLDVSAYDTLILRATFQISAQSLSGCGYLGSECPLTVGIDYIDVDGDGEQWFHGFYAFVDAALNWPLYCVSCGTGIPHDPLNIGMWYTYETDNLFTLLSPEDRPTSILNIQFYSSGHQYDIYLSELALLAGSFNTQQASDAP
jgi:hypothetical protein